MFTISPAQPAYARFCRRHGGGSRAFNLVAPVVTSRVKPVRETAPTKTSAGLMAASVLTKKPLARRRVGAHPAPQQHEQRVESQVLGRQREQQQQDEQLSGASSPQIESEPG